MTISCSVTVLTAQYYTVVAATVLIVSIMPIPGADKNSLLQALPRFKQIVTQPTHGNKTIDVIIMNCADLYAVPQHTASILAGRPAFSQKLRKNKMTYLNRTCFKHLTLVRQVDIKLFIGSDEISCL